MTDFAVEQPLGIAAMFMDSAQYLLDSVAVLRHLDASRGRSCRADFTPSRSDTPGCVPRGDVA
jgi:hypothetical protein